MDGRMDGWMDGYLLAFCWISNGHFIGLWAFCRIVGILSDLMRILSGKLRMDGWEDRWMSADR